MVALMARHAESDKPIHPLRQWRERNRVSQEQLAERTGLTQGMISHIERYFRIPLGEALEALLQQTGLPTDAFIRAERFVAEQPDFLRKYRRRSKRRDGMESREDT
jgi:transcriptional regulator with XRE-family HTH domain